MIILILFVFIPHPTARESTALLKLVWNSAFEWEIHTRDWYPYPVINCLLNICVASQINKQYLSLRSKLLIVITRVELRHSLTTYLNFWVSIEVELITYMCEQDIFLLRIGFSLMLSWAVWKVVNINKYFTIHFSCFIGINQSLFME